MAKPILMHTAELLEYSFGDEHPMGPDRVRLAMELSDHFGILDAFDILEPPPHDRELVARFHSPDYIAALESGEPDIAFGIGDNDHPLAPGLHRVAMRIAGATVAATQAVWEGRASRALNISGGLHHAMSHMQAGFCIYNDAVLAIDWLLQNGAQRVAYVDLDAHHGDGVEAAFWDDPRVLTISVHESGLYLFPYTGFSKDIGGPNALGTAVNLPMNKGTNDEEWLRAVHGICQPILQKFRPEIIISQHGGDPHRRDPLADLEISIDAMTLAYRSVAKWANRYAGGKWVAVGGGGYNRDSVARAWAGLAATVAGTEIPAGARMPDNWEQRARVPQASATFGDEGVGTFKTGSIVEGSSCPSTIATSKAVFPYWGLQPLTGF